MNNEIYVPLSIILEKLSWAKHRLAILSKVDQLWVERVLDQAFEELTKKSIPVSFGPKVTPGFEAKTPGDQKQILKLNNNIVEIPEKKYIKKSYNWDDV